MLATCINTILRDFLLPPGQQSLIGVLQVGLIIRRNSPHLSIRRVASVACKGIYRSKSKQIRHHGAQVSQVVTSRTIDRTWGTIQPSMKLLEF